MSEIVVSLCDRSGRAVEPWRQAGFHLHYRGHPTPERVEPRQTRRLALGRRRSPLPLAAGLEGQVRLRVPALRPLGQQRRAMVGWQGGGSPDDGALHMGRLHPAHALLEGPGHLGESNGPGVDPSRPVHLCLRSARVRRLGGQLRCGSLHKTHRHSVLRRGGPSCQKACAAGLGLQDAPAPWNCQAGKEPDAGGLGSRRVRGQHSGSSIGACMNPRCKEPEVPE